jgi:hypothetical protein
MVRVYVSAMLRHQFRDVDPFRQERFRLAGAIIHRRNFETSLNRVSTPEAAEGP